MTPESGQPTIKTALEALEEGRGRPRLTTGSGDLDGLIGGIEPGSFYHFYGEPEILDLIIHRLLVHAVLPVERGGLDGKAIYFNNTDYYGGRSILNPSRLGLLAKHVGVDPKLVFRNVEVAVAYNEERQRVVARRVAELIREDGEIRLLAVHHITRFLQNSRRPRESRQALKGVVGELWRAASERRVALFMTGDAAGAGRGFIPRPLGGAFLRQAATILVYFKKFLDGPISSYKAVLVKHPYKPTPDSLVLYVRQPGAMDLLTGRSLPSFQQLYEERMDQLKRLFQNQLQDLGHRHAFDLLLKGAWSVELTALSKLGEYTLLDGLNLTSSLHVRALIEEARGRLQRLDDAIGQLAGEVEELRAILQAGMGLG